MRVIRGKPALLCFVLLSAIYLFYWPHAEFVVDDWFLMQHFEQARAQGAQAEWKLAGVLFRSELWGAFRTHWLSLLAVFGLYQLGGLHAGFYFLTGILLHTLAAFLLYRLLVRLDLDAGASFLAGALFLLLPTSRNPLFWFAACGHYVLAGLWSLIYLHLVAGTIFAKKLRARAAAAQALALVLALFSTDQAAGLLLFAALWMALVYKSRAALASGALAWVAVPAAGGLYAGLCSTPRAASAVALRFHVSPAQVAMHGKAILSDYRQLLGIGSGFYRIRLIGWGAAAALAAGFLAFWFLRCGPAAQRKSARRIFLLGAGLWAIAYGPVWVLNWSELRYEYLPTLGLSMALAAAAYEALRPLPRALFPAGAGLLAAYCAATAYAEMQQCWIPQARHLRSAARQLRNLKDLQYHDVIVIAAAPPALGTAPHFALTSCPYSSTPFAEITTGVKGLLVGREIFCEAGKLQLLLNDMYPLREADLRRTHVLFTEDNLDCRLRTILACESEPGAYELHPLKDYRGPPPAVGRACSHDELRAMEGFVYVAQRHRK
jgi:hypothetical protein